MFHLTKTLPILAVLFVVSASSPATAAVEAWVAWAASLVEGTDDERRAAAEASIAVLDGLYLVRLLVGPDAADRAADVLGAS